jgi:N-methylhydantoinase B/oxoprolinase/acetone carboxylase alpha subunit
MVNRPRGNQFHFDPATYLGTIRAEVPAYDELQDAVAEATAGIQAERVLELGVGTGGNVSAGGRPDGRGMPASTVFTAFHAYGGGTGGWPTAAGPGLPRTSRSTPTTVMRAGSITRSIGS